MKKFLILILLVISLMFLGVNTASAAAPSQKYTDVSSYNASYYSSVSGKKGDSLLEGLASLSNTKHRYYTSYDELWDAIPYADKDLKNSGKVLDFYTQKSISSNHTTGAGADIHHIRPCIDNINSSRGNNRYGNVDHSNAKYYSFANDKVSSSSSDTLYGYAANKAFTKEETKSLGERNWRMSGTDGMYLEYTSAKGEQFGSATDPAYSLNITSTTDFDLITSIYITACGASGTEAKLNICVSSVSYGERTLTDSPKTYRVTPGGVSGRVSFKFTQSTAKGVAKAIYIKEIKVYYTSGAAITYTADGDIITESAPTKQFAFNEFSLNLVSDVDLTKRYVPVSKKTR